MHGMEAQEIIVMHPKARMSRKLANDLRHCDHYISFGENYQKIRKFENKLGGKIARLNISSDIEEVFPVVAKAFSDKIAVLSKQHKHMEFWWLSHYTEKNGWPSEHITIDCMVEWLRKRNRFKKLVLVTSRPYFCFCLGKDLPNARVIVHGKRRFFLGFFVKYWLILKGLQRLIGGYLGRKCCMLIYGIPKRLRDIVVPDNVFILRVYVNEKKLPESGKFIDSHYGDTQTLKTYIEKKGYSVVLEPNLSSVTNPKIFFDWVKRLAKDKFWLPEASLSIRDLLKAICIGMSNVLLCHKLGFRVIAQANSFYFYYVASGYMKAQLPAVLQKQGVCPKVVLFNWENKGYEKYMQLLFDELLPSTKVIGYMNAFSAPILPEFLAYPNENAIAPYPDELICKSRYICDNLRGAGVNERILKVGPALRDLYIYNVSDAPADTKDKSYFKTILACLPINVSLSLELIEVIGQFLLLSDDYKIILKPHPYFNIKLAGDNLKRLIEKNIVRVSMQPMSEELNKAFNFIYSGPTSTACEAAILGKRVLRYVSANQLSLDALYYDKNIKLSAFSSAAEMLKILDNAPRNLMADVEKKRYFYEPLDPDLSNLEVFV